MKTKLFIVLIICIVAFALSPSVRTLILFCCIHGDPDYADMKVPEPGRNYFGQIRYNF